MATVEDDDDDVGRGPLGWQGCSLLACSGVIMLGILAGFGVVIAGLLR